MDRAQIKNSAVAAGQLLTLTEADRFGPFVWREGDFSSRVAQDTSEGIYIASDSVPSSQGAWVRQFDGPRYASWFSVVGDGVVDDSAALNSCFSNCERGVTVRFSEDAKVKINSTITIPDFCCLEGSFQFNGAIHPPLIVDAGPSIWLSPSATISVGNNSCVRNIGIFRQGLTFGVSSAVVESTFLGTAITLRPKCSDAHLSGLAILGFHTAIGSHPNATNVSRFHIRDINLDCKNGISLRNNYDVGYIREVHGWPFVTVGSTPETGDAHLKRFGAFIRLQGANDWAKVTDCFSFGHFIGYHIASAHSCTLTGCSADHPPAAVSDGSIGFLVDGNACEIRIIGGQAAGKTNAIYINTSWPHGAVSVTNFNAWEFDNNGIVVAAGRLIETGSVFRRSGPSPGTSGITVLPSAQGATITGSHIEGVTIGVNCLHPAATVNNATFANIGAAAISR